MDKVEQTALDKLDAEISALTDKLANLEVQIEQARDKDEVAALRRKEEQLRREKEQLRTEKEQLRAKELLLMQQQSGALVRNAAIS